jgi:hypothetical protein
MAVGSPLMKALMDEVRFEEGGVVVHMRKSARKGAATKCLELEEVAEIGQLPITIQIEIEHIYWRENLCLRLSKPAPSKN